MIPCRKTWLKTAVTVTATLSQVRSFECLIQSHLSYTQASNESCVGPGPFLHGSLRVLCIKGDAKSPVIRCHSSALNNYNRLTVFGPAAEGGGGGGGGKEEAFSNKSGSLLMQEPGQVGTRGKMCCTVFLNECHGCEHSISC